jgi:acyl-coenzyme A thioesterase PaaI-like protein
LSFDPASFGWQPYDDPALPRVMESHWIRHDEAVVAFGFQTGPGQQNGRGAVHGGILATYMDHTIGRIARESVENAPVATIQLDLHYLAPAKPGQFIEARGIVVRRTRSVIFLRGTLIAEGKEVLSASGIWKILGRP